MLRATASLAVLAASLAAAGCQSPAGVGGPCVAWRSLHGRPDTGESACKEQLYFPSGAAVDPDGDALYVSNANADLRYNGGTVAMVDLEAVECAIAYFRAGGSGPLPSDPACAAVSDALAPSLLASLAPSKSLYDGCVRDPLDPGIVECDEGAFIVDAVRVGNFGGQIVVQQRPTGAVRFPVVDGTCPSDVADGGAAPADGGAGDGGVSACVAPSGFSRRLWLPVRGDPSVTWIDVSKKPLGLSCNDPSNTGRGNGVPDACGAQRITVRDFHRDMPGAPTKTPTPIPSEPFGLALDEGLLTDGQTAYSRLTVTHLTSGEVTLINAGAFHPTSTADQPTPSERVVLDVRGGFFPLDTSMRAGSYAAAPRVAGDPTTEWYLTSRLNPSVAEFRVADVGVLLPTTGFNVMGGPFAVGNDIRQLAFEPDGSRGFFLENNPPALFTVDTRVDPSLGGVPRNQVIDEIALCQEPSRMGFARWQEGAGVVTRAYVVCFTTGQVMVVDPDLGRVESIINVGIGANDIALNFGGHSAEPRHRRGYVANYGESSVSVIDLERGSPTENRVIFRVGLTSPPPVMM